MSKLRIWGLVPARGGSKSIPLKNLVLLVDRPMLDYGIGAALAWGGLEVIYCSTENKKISQRALELGVDVDIRPPHLAGDDVHVADVARDFLLRKKLEGLLLPDFLFLIQPTSPMILPEHFSMVAKAINSDKKANSVQTVIQVPHNYHAWNQREITNNNVTFFYSNERAKAYNKQKKPPLYAFGNLVAVRVESLLAGGDFFNQPSLAVVIPRSYGLDVDGPDDLIIAETLLSKIAFDSQGI